jgi:hypothetical protein
VNIVFAEFHMVLEQDVTEILGVDGVPKEKILMNF